MRIIFSSKKVKVVPNPAKKKGTTEINIKNTQDRLKDFEIIPRETSNPNEVKGIEVSHETSPHERKRNQRNHESVISICNNEKKKTGRWGENFAYNTLKDVKIEEFTKSYKKEDLVFQENNYQFNIFHKNVEILELRWINSMQERRKPYGIYMKEYDAHYFIEVKSTTTENKDWFDVSKNQCDLACLRGEQFWFFRVYKARSANPKYEIIKDPETKWKEGQIIAYASKIQL